MRDLASIHQISIDLFLLQIRYHDPEDQKWHSYWTIMTRFGQLKKLPDHLSDVLEDPDYIAAA